MGRADWVACGELCDLQGGLVTDGHRGMVKSCSSLDVAWEDAGCVDSSPGYRWQKAGGCWHELAVACRRTVLRDGGGMPANCWVWDGGHEGGCHEGLAKPDVVE